MPTEEDDVLERLSQALRPPDAAPSPSELAELRRAVADQAPAPIPRAWPRRVAVAAAAAVILVVVVIGPPLPRPVRSLAHGLGLPVDSAEVADAKAAMDQLQAALDEGDPAKVEAASARLERRLARLRTADRNRFAGRAEPLLERARQSGAQARPVPPARQQAPGQGPPATTGPATSAPPQRPSSSTTSTTSPRTSTTSRTASTVPR